ncbi:MAG: hypothetical protein SW833_02475 [Cyanobacteriota bacterium]|nr:hypothetical protein [Cyanobacteriota bacterium]
MATIAIESEDVRGILAILAKTGHRRDRATASTHLTCTVFQKSCYTLYRYP